MYALSLLGIWVLPAGLQSCTTPPVGTPSPVASSAPLPQAGYLGACSRRHPPG